MKRRVLHEKQYMYKDGVYIMPIGHVNASSPSLKVAVYQNNQQRMTRKADSVEEAVEFAYELSADYSLPIYDALAVGYSHFADEYIKMDNLINRDDPYYAPITKDPNIEHLTFTDEDLYDMDGREEVITHWAICTDPGIFRIYDNVQKNPEKFWDTRMHRGLGDYHVDDRIEDFIEFMDSNNADVYEGTWEDLAGAPFTVLVNGRIYESQKVEKIFNKIIKAGLEVDGNKIHGVTDLDKMDEFENEIFLNFDSSNDIAVDLIPEVNVEEELTVVYDCLTCIGLLFPEEFEMSFREKSYTILINDNQIEMSSTEKLQDFRNLEVGDVLVQADQNSLDTYSPKFVIVDIDSKKAKISKVSNRVPTNSHWYPYYKEVFDINQYDNALANSEQYGDGFKGKIISLAKPGNYKLWKKADKIAQFRDDRNAEYLLD